VSHERERYTRRSGGDPDIGIMLLVFMVLVALILAMGWLAGKGFGAW
jgi:hypothetical protein